VAGSGPLTAQLWSSIDATYGAILEHPFITGLTDGSLDQAAFRFYVIQDAHYLREFARALSVAAARAPEERDIAMFNEHAAGAIAVERQLHESFFSDFGVSEADVAATPMAPTNLAYTSYLLAVAYGESFAQALAALLPCYWIYWEVGKQLLERGSPDALYRRWIATYRSEENAAIVKAVLALTDRVGENLSTSERDSMQATSRPPPATNGCSGTWAIARSSGRSKHGAASASVTSDRPSKWSTPTHLRGSANASPYGPPASSGPCPSSRRAAGCRPVPRSRAKRTSALIVTAAPPPGEAALSTPPTPAGIQLQQGAYCRPSPSSRSLASASPECSARSIGAACSRSAGTVAFRGLPLLRARGRAAGI
jgi:thiaminase (transcriptional activator TenA)